MSDKRADRIINELRINCEHEAADLIEQLQAERDALQKENDTFRSSSNGYKSIISHFEESPLFKEVREEFWKNQWLSEPALINATFDKAYEGYLSDSEYQTRLAEVKAKAVEDAAKKLKFEREIETERMIAPPPEELVYYDDLIDEAAKIRLGS